MKKFLLFFPIFFIAEVCLAYQGSNTADSLKNELAQHAAKDTVRVLLLVELSNAIYYSTPDEAMHYANEALKISKALHWDKGIALALREQGNVYYNFPDFIKAMDRFQKALLIAEKIQNKVLIGSLYNNLGNINADLDYHDKAIKYYEKCLSIAREQHHERYVLISLTNIGTVYNGLDSLNEALKYYFEALKVAEKLQIDRFIASIINNIGVAYKKKEEYPSAKKYLSKALQMGEHIGMKYLNATALNNLGKVNLLQSNLKEAEIQALQALSIAKEINMLEWQADAHYILSGVYEKTSRTKQALKAYKEYMQLMDSILNEEKKAALTKKGLQFEFQKKTALLKAEQDKKAALAAAEIQRQKLLRNSSIIGTVLILVGGIVSFLFYKSRQNAIEEKQKAKLEALITETELKILRAQMNPHFIFNSLNSISDYITRHDTKTADYFLTKFAKLMRITLENLEQEEISLSDDLGALELYMQLEMLRMNKAFSYEIRLEDTIDANAVLVPPLILQPFVENSIWHGLAKKESDGKIIIQIKKEGDMINCIIEDNGIGREKAVQLERRNQIKTKKSYGMKITQTRIGIMNKIKRSDARIELADLAEGFHVTVKLPLVLDY